jgi:RNA polymerase sigma-70 factor (sigma-E family)
LGFEEFVRARLPALLRYAAVLTGDAHRAEDLMQDVLVKAERRWRRIKRMDAPEAYVRKMLTNEFLSWRRRRSSGEIVLSPEALRTVVGAGGDHAMEFGDRDQVQESINALPPRQRVALTLRYYEDLSYAEIGEMLGCTEGTARSHVSRAVAAMRIDLTAQAVEGAQ